jgi:hypothetical protein
MGIDSLISLWGIAFFISKQREYDYPNPYGHEGQKDKKGATI